MGESVQDCVPTRPRIRSDCEDGLRPCPWIGCRYHLFWELAPIYLMQYKGYGKHPKLRLEQFTDAEVVECLSLLRHTCALDLIEPGGVVLDILGEYLDVSREMARLLEDHAIKRFCFHAPVVGIPLVKQWLVPPKEAGSRPTAAARGQGYKPARRRRPSSQKKIRALLARLKR